MRKITFISVHTSDSVYGSATAIRAWHKQRGWNDIGYHFVILNGLIKHDLYFQSMNGSIEYGRPIEFIPASIKGHNEGQIAICLVGKGGKYTVKQMESLTSLLAELLKKYNLRVKDIKGHYELNKNKTCPDIDMNKLRAYMEVLVNESK